MKPKRMSGKTQLPQPAQVNEEGEEIREEGEGEGKRIEKKPEWIDGRRWRVICRHMPTTILILTLANN